ncbi:hypothetical protein ALP73_101608 [Pseudomonas coronafaciens pv. garcae]|uniref:Lipoprotein n=3 Tax=Pseudomonas syringae group TaxID=136849 RepID=A0AB37QQB8_9PSED|nr:hypothetical protein ALO38_100948 [Pseudomonas coronafaciens pv. zizaniae]RML54151.1 hypothetical protein ALQ93_101983 [Pseudomonas syringae pv. pisi]RMM75650.1 hypothetical protein ALQ72_100582 [Pseudomonas syringae pv. maculicola]RMM80700.1 hypothetical protein ALQ71_101548 [Pseudomonas coronafaciens pv. striafaciens]RMR98238.1 hypothetical protein ALP73_101608 [Pseudomonas coronafaciens pv. garcae]RMS13980.1 hypothetical protein ALP72_101644 [Pseudomonas coronafaciens pv. coronafaciens]
MLISNGPLRSQSAKGHSINAIPTPVMGFIAFTVPLKAKGDGYDYPILVRIEFERQSDNSVQLISRGGHTGTLIINARRVSISCNEWDNRPYDPP